MSGMHKFIDRLRILLTDVIHGIDAGNAIRHGRAPSPADPARLPRC